MIILGSYSKVFFYRSILLAGCMGFQGIKTEATGTFSKTAFETVGLLSSSSIKYEDFEFEGKKVFSGMDGDFFS